MIDFDSILIVIVIYNIKLDESPAFRSLTDALARDQPVSLFVYDNSLSPQRIITHARWDISYWHNASNPGVSKAYNEGFRFAKKTNKKWLLLADQDTIFPANCFDEYIKAANEHPIVVPTLRDKFGIASPLRFYFGGGQRVKSFGNKTILKLRDFLFHNSGVMIATETFERAGGYDERLRLDFSDFAFVHRLRAHCREFVVADFSCTHRLATSEATSLDERLLRFESYASAGRYFNKTYASSNWLLLPRIFLRGIKFCLQYRTHKFMGPFFWHK